MNYYAIISLEKKKWPQKSWLADHMEKGWSGGIIATLQIACKLG